MNYVKLHDVLVNELGMKDPIIISNINSVGFRMNPSRSEVEATIKKHDSFNIAMSILASGAIKPQEAVDYIASLNEGVDAVLFGASSREHIRSTKEMLEKIF